MNSLDWTDRDTAPFVDLRGYPASQEAHAFVESILQDVVAPAWPDKLQQRPTSIIKHRAALGGLLADLLRQEMHNRPIKHGLSPGDWHALNVAGIKPTKIAAAYAAALDADPAPETGPAYTVPQRVPTGAQR